MTEGSAEWSSLVAFPIALVVLLLLALEWLIHEKRKGTPDLEDGLDANAYGDGTLKYLESAWSFKESWASNVTVAAGLVAGIFGSSEVVTALGTNGKPSLALATVGAALAAALVAAGPLILLASKKEDFLTVGGLLAASAVTLAGGFGELWVLFRAGERLNLGAGWSVTTGVMAGLAALLLGWYAIKSIPAVIRTGQTEPPTAPPSDTLTAATMIVKAIKAASGLETADLDAAFKAASDLHPDLHKASGLPHKRRTALL